MKKDYKIGIRIFVSFLILAFSYWIIKQSCNDDFWDATFYEIISIFATIILGIIGFSITILIVEEKNDNRRLVDATVVIIDKMDLIIESNILVPQTTNVESEEHKKLLSAKRNFTNYITLLENNAKRLKVTTEIDFIKTKFHDYEVIIDTCFDNKTIKRENKSKIETLLNLANQKLCEVRIKLYTPKQ